MKIAFINGSPKVKDSSSGCILEELKTLLLKDSSTILEYSFRKSSLTSEELEKLAEYEVLVFAFPLYVDGIPSHLLRCLIQIETFFRRLEGKKITVYAISNCGFYEGHQNRLALEIMENWCIRAGFKWGQGIGIGAGGMLQGLKNVPLGKGPKKNLGKALNTLVSNISNQTSGQNIFISANFPRLLYKLSAEMGWRIAVKENGLQRKDLFLRK